MKEKICFIVQRYGAQVNGGAELFCKQMAEHMTEKYDVTVLTTCAVEYMTWEDFFAPGEEMINGVHVIRFRVDYTRDAGEFNAINGKFLTGGLNTEQEKQWIELQGPYCAGIINYISSYKYNYKSFVFCTYLYYPTVMGLPEVAHKSVLIPMAHDEPYIQMQLFQNLFSIPRGILYLTPEEKEFVNEKFNNQEIYSEIGGIGVDIPPDYSAQRFKEKYKIEGKYVIYVGRIDEGKNCGEMFAFWQQYKQNNPSNLKLVLLGKSVIPVPEREDILSLGFVSDQDKFDAISGAQFMWIPSKFESLSIVLLEALALSVPVIVNENCEVLKGHCLRSNAGIYYKDYATFCCCMDVLLQDEEVLTALSNAGPMYVKSNFDWENTTGKLEALVEYVGKNSLPIPFLPNIPQPPKMKKIGFISPWFGENIAGGAETALRDITFHLQEKGIDLEILTTCAKENGGDWGENYYPERIEWVNGVLVRRFSVEPIKNIFSELNKKIIQREKISLEQESLFLENFINSDRLYTYIREHEDEYSQFVFLPYLFSTSYFGSAAAGKKAVLIPCFHEEGYAYMQLLRERYSNVAGMIFLSEKEKEFAEKTYDLQNAQTAIIGLGMDLTKKGVKQDFCEKFEIHSPFILYAGRKDEGKNADMLVSFFAQYKKENPSDLKLVLVGSGKVQSSWSESQEDIIDLGFLEEQDKLDAFAAASFLCQPSYFESFSIVIMESWLQGRPVLVHENCDVTRNFVERSNGGLYFNGYAQFSECVSTFLKNLEISVEMGLAGKHFVETNFNWETVSEKYIAFFKKKANYTEDK